MLSSSGEPCGIRTHDTLTKSQCGDLACLEKWWVRLEHDDFLHRPIKPDAPGGIDVLPDKHR